MGKIWSRSSQEEELVEYGRGGRKGGGSDTMIERKWYQGEWKLEGEICAEWERRWSEILDAVNENDELKNHGDGEKMECKKKKSKNVRVKKWRCWRSGFGWVLRAKIKRQGDEGRRLAGEELFLIFCRSQMEYPAGLSVKFNYLGKTPSWWALTHQPASTGPISFHLNNTHMQSSINIII